MWNPFRTEMPLKSGSAEYPAEAGFPAEHYLLPSTVTLDDTPGVSQLTEAGDPTAYRGVVDDRAEFQATNPDYAGTYVPGFTVPSGVMPEFQSTNPAPGSVDLAFPRQAGEVVGHDRVIATDGPVTGDNNPWTGERTALPSWNPNYPGPVVGGPDYSQQLVQAYFQTQAAMAAQQYADAAMVSAV